MNINYAPDGGFSQVDPEKIRGIYFPLMNPAGYKAVVTPRGKGDAKYDQNSFLFPPVSEQDVINGPASRNFWIHVPGEGSWSVFAHEGAGVEHPDSESRVEAGFLWYRLIRRNAVLGLQAEATFFAPADGGLLECARVDIKNIGTGSKTLSVTGCYMLYGRSADAIRDHRHVTSLLNRSWVVSDGVVLRPTLSFDERGHLPNTMSYYGLAAGWMEGSPLAIGGFFVDQADYTGEAGSMQVPQGVTEDVPAPNFPGDQVDGCETVAGFRFTTVNLSEGQSMSVIMTAGLGGHPGKMTPEALKDFLAPARSLLSPGAFQESLKSTEQYWKGQLARLQIRTGKPEFNHWLTWVGLQPIMRRIFGCSFMPHHDYGRGGRGWRDLWQDCLALLLTEPEQVGDLLFHNFAGVRIDGSNATIIGDKPGEFHADRNNIPRLWMDHGAWPLVTLNLYLNQTGDYAFLLRRQTYFQDQHTHRCSQVNPSWVPEDGLTLKTKPGGKSHQGAVIEHVLVQHLTAYYAAGESGSLSLEGADWNDGLDMARNRGESVAFTSLYGRNLMILSEWITVLERQGLAESLILPKELQILLPNPAVEDTPPMDARLRRQRLTQYCDAVEAGLSGETGVVSCSGLVQTLRIMGTNLLNHVAENEYLTHQEDGWFNGYYDDHHRRLEDVPLVSAGDRGQSNRGQSKSQDSTYGQGQEQWQGQKEPRITLTGQTFPLMAGVPNPDQAERVMKTVRRLLWDDRVGGVRLNSNFNEVKLDMGRLFGFAYGHKENGAMFSHMAVMYAFGLYEWQGMYTQGNTFKTTPEKPLGIEPNAEAEQVLLGIWNHTRNTEVNRLYPGIPEYINQQGRGMYPYLTGSASWYMLTLLTQTLGIRGDDGDLLLQPRFTRDLLGASNTLEADFYFAGKDITLRYLVPQAHPNRMRYRISRVTINQKTQSLEEQLPGGGVRFSADALQKIAGAGERLFMEVTLDD